MPAPSDVRPRSPGFWTTALLFWGNVLGYLDRAAFAIAAPIIMREMALTPAQLGWLLSAFSIGYVGMTFFGGAAADRFGPGRVIAVAATSWSIFCAMTAAPVPLWALLMIRILFGAGEAPYTPSVNAIVAATAAPRRYSGLLALISAGQPIGGLLAGPVVGGITLAYGWRAGFLLIGALGLAWSVLWTLRLAGARTSLERPHPAAGRADRRAIGPVVARCLSSPAIVAVALAYFGFGYILYFLITWFPTYLVKGLGASVAEMSRLTTYPWGAGLVGLLAGGLLLDALQRTSRGAIVGRRAVIAISLVTAGVGMGATAFVADIRLAVALMSLAAFAIYLTGTCYLGLVRELVDPRQVGSIGGFVLCGASLGGIVAPAVTGFLVERTGGFAAAFVVVGFVAIIGAAVVHLLVKDEVRVDSVSSPRASTGLKGSSAT